ncbi:MAG: AsmA family protein [Methylobacter sp.]|uniref:AsmA family protein n=1 Tax=Methylobacter sp. TaxID=2051955 RepID=UPI0025F46FEE|nr:AsmA family protein [Methylobacter sp.]MCK9621817.1 AsmA family protein [Methylobacter sp.]
MGKPFKIILSTIAAMALLLIAVVSILPFVINPNDFKPEIIAAVKDKTGRELTLDGELKLSLFPWAGISTEKIALSNAPEFQDRPFATIEEGNIGIRLLPLLSKKAEISRIVLKGLVLNLARNKQGLTNWDDLTASDLKTAPAVVADKTDAQPVPEQTTFSIGDITIENARINWDDLKTEKHIEIKDLNLNADKLIFDEPANITASMTVLKSGSTLIHAIKLNTELTVNEKLDTFALRRSDLHVVSSGEAVSGQPLTTVLAIADAALNWNQQTAKIQGLQLKSGDVSLAAAEMTGTSIKDKPSFQGLVTIAPFSPAKVMQQLAIALPAMQDASALSKLAANFDLTATGDSADLQNLALTLDDTQIKGAISIKSFAESVISFNLGIDALDVDRYLSPRNKSSKPIASPAVLLAVGLSALPVETLRKLSADGTVSVEKLKVNDLAMQDVRINLSSKNGVFTTQQAVQQFYQGSYSGDLHMDTHGDKPALAVNEKIDHVQIEPLLKDYRGEAPISGMVNASAQLQGQGRKTKELKTSLNGQLSFMFKDSVLKGFNLQKIIDEGKALIKGSALPSDNKNDQTLFSEMTGTATITNGLIQNNDLVAKSSKLRVDGKGNVNLNSEAVDYKIDAKLLDATATEPEQVKGAVAINVAGTLDKPLYTIDLESLLSDKNKAKIDKLINKLDKKLGPGLGNLLKGILK